MIILLCIYFCILGCYCNQYDPHVFPEKGPFFEGWYIRIIDLDIGKSFAVLCGSVDPEDLDSKLPLGYAGLLYTADRSQRLINYDAFPSISDISITVKNNQPVSGNPDLESPAEFKWIASNTLNITVNPKEAYIFIDVHNTTFKATLTDHQPWGRYGFGPMGWLHYVPLPLSWFVYSVSSRVSDYSFQPSIVRQNSENGIRKTGGNVFAHMEKNWGHSFPNGWIWAQGIKERGVSFALTYGPVDVFAGITATGFLTGYRNNNKDIAIDFTNVDSFPNVELDGCNGYFRMRLTSLLHSIEFELTADNSTFGACLPGPMANGFKYICSESFAATCHVTLWRRDWFSWTVEDQQDFPLSALEFGGDLSCHKCPATRQKEARENMEQ